MVKLIGEKTYLYNGKLESEESIKSLALSEQLSEAYKGTIAYSILSAHNKLEVTKKGSPLKIAFDAMASHDITYVGIIQTAKASGLEKFPLPYVLTNCHNSLCAVGGTINEDDHVFGLSAAKKYGGIFVPPHQAVIHTYMRERMSACGKMILGSDSHTRYGALGTMAVGEGGPELVKQLLGQTYDISYPDIIAVYLTGEVKHGVGPQDVALALIKAVFSSGFVKNKVLEFVGDGVDKLPIEFRNGIDVMTTETTCLSSIWKTDEKVEEYFKTHLRFDAYKKLEPKKVAMYDGAVVIDLATISPMIAMPFHPSNGYELKDVIANPGDVMREVEENAKKLLGSKANSFSLTDKIGSDGKIRVSQGIIAGCAGGTYDNIQTAANILRSGEIVANNDFTFSVYPSSQPIYMDLMKKGALAPIIEAGGIVKTAFCGPCFGAGDVPSNNTLSIRHTTRNFENREGSKPGDKQIAGVALMDSRSIAATALNGGVLTSAEDVDYDEHFDAFEYDKTIYERRVYNGWTAPDASKELVYGPNIAPWPDMIALTDNLIIKVVASILDPVTTTDELIPSGETSSYRSNPLRLAEYALSRKVPEYVGRAKAVYADEKARRSSGELASEYREVLRKIGSYSGSVSIGSAIYAVKPGDGSAREQAASCQRVLGGVANIASEYATKRYRSNLINWGMLPFVSDTVFEEGDYIFVPDVRGGVANLHCQYCAKLVRGGNVTDVTLSLGDLTNEERQIILSGCLINYNRDLSKSKEK